MTRNCTVAILLFLIAACADTTAPEVGANEVGIINETRYTISWGIRFTETRATVGGLKTGTLPYSERGYWVMALDIEVAHSPLNILAGAGETIVYDIVNGRASVSIRP